MKSNYRHWCFTSFKFDYDEPEKPRFSSKVRYAIWQLEECPTTGKWHLQGYAEFKNTIRIKAAAKAIGDPKAHMSVRKGTRDEARNYCLKDSTKLKGPWEYGIWIKGQGHRTDLDEVSDMIKNETKEVEIFESHPTTYIKYSRGIKAARELIGCKTAPTWREMSVFVIIGMCGVGKTRGVVEKERDNLFIVDDPGGKELWWDGYNGEEAILIDDFNGWISYKLMLKIMDGYKLRLPIKGGFTYARWTRVYITSNEMPNTWWIEGQSEAFTRRVTEFIDM